jgi:sulfur-oxidizing protein SoxY
MAAKQALGKQRAGIRRRQVLQGLVNTLIGLLSVWRWTSSSAKSVDATLQEVFGTTRFPHSDRIELTVANLAEDGAVVPVHVSCKLPGVETISLVADNNPVPLIARFHLQAPLSPNLGTRIKLAASTDVRAIVTTRTGTFETRKYVRVIQGGCDLPPAA